MLAFTQQTRELSVGCITRHSTLLTQPEPLAVTLHGTHGLYSMQLQLVVVVWANMGARNT